MKIFETRASLAAAVQDAKRPDPPAQAMAALLHPPASGEVPPLQIQPAESNLES